MKVKIDDVKKVLGGWVDEWVVEERYEGVLLTQGNLSVLIEIILPQTETVDMLWRYHDFWSGVTDPKRTDVPTFLKRVQTQLNRVNKKPDNSEP